MNLNLVLYFFHVDFGFQIFLCFLGNTLLYDRVVIMLERHFGKRSNGGIWKLFLAALRERATLDEVEVLVFEEHI